MNGGQSPAKISKEGRRTVSEAFRKLTASLTDYKGSCLFVINEHGKYCGQPVSNNCHIVSEPAVLHGLRDPKIKKVLGLQWRVGQWHKLLFGEAPLQLAQDPGHFDPSESTTHDACVGWFACKQLAHDDEFLPIDVAQPDFSDPAVRFLCAYRMSMYIADQYRQALELHEEWSQEALRSPNHRSRKRWLAEKGKLRKGHRVAEAAVSSLGKKWYARKDNEKFPVDHSSTMVLPFRSKLKFAGGVAYGNHAAVTVFPGHDHSHNMAVFNLKHELVSEASGFEHLANVARATEVSDNYGVSVTRELMTNGWGSLALSPESYRALNDEEQLNIRRLVFRHSQDEGLMKSYSLQPSMRKRGRKWR